MCEYISDGANLKGRELTKWAKDEIIQQIENRIKKISESEVNDLHNAIALQLKRIKKFLGSK